MNMDIRPLVAESDLDWALAEVDRYFVQEPAPESMEAARFQVLLALIETYESKHWPIGPVGSIQPVQVAGRYKVHPSQRVPFRQLTRHRAA